MRLVGNVEGYDVDHEYSVLQYETEKSRDLAKASGQSDWAAMRSRINLKRCIVATLPFTYQNVCPAHVRIHRLLLPTSRR
jgi:hypothetical protein